MLLHACPGASLRNCSHLGPQFSTCADAHSPRRASITTRAKICRLTACPTRKGCHVCQVASRQASMASRVSGGRPSSTSRQMSRQMSQRLPSRTASRHSSSAPFCFRQTHMSLLLHDMCKLVVPGTSSSLPCAHAEMLACTMWPRMVMRALADQREALTGAAHELPMLWLTSKQL